MTKYVFLPGPAHGHVNPTLAVAQELVRRGEQVVYYLTEEFRATVEATGATFRPYQSMMNQFTMGDRQPPSRQPWNATFIFGAMLLTIVKESQHVIPQVLERLRAEQADVILYDPMCLWARIIAQVLHVPAILLRPTFAANEHFQVMPPQTDSTPSLPPGMFVDMQAEFTELCTSYNLQPLAIGDVFTQSEALNIVFMPRAFQPAGETFDERFVFVGPSILPRPDAPAFPLERLDGQTTLFISLGTAANNRPDFYNLCFRAFGHQPWQVVLAHGKRVDLAALDVAPPNFLLAAYVPQLEVLQRTSVFVTHGGMNSVMEGLYFGVPVVVVPQMREQEVTAERCAELGLGVALDNADLTAETLRAAVEYVHHTSPLGEHVRAMQRTMLAAGGYQRAVEVIIHFASMQNM
jgi:MGT family glycosyltransferase